MLDRGGLVGVELLDAAGPESAQQPVINPWGIRGVVGRPGREDADCRDPAVRSVWAVSEAASQAVEHGLQLGVPAA
jgi:hypothetical protein